MSVDKEGDLEIKGNPRIIYQIMVKTRLNISAQAAANLIQGGQIVIRYAICRRQFKNQKGVEKERKLLDYQTHMATIAPHIANGYIIYLSF